VSVPSTLRRGMRRPGRTRPARVGLLAVAVLAVLGASAALVSGPAAPLAGAAMTRDIAPAVSGYRMLAADGGVFSFGASFFGAPSADPTRCVRNPSARSMPYGSCWSMAPTHDGGGYYVLDAFSGKIYTYGDAVSYGQPADSFGGGADRWPTSVDLAVTPDGKGYWALENGLSALASVQAFGDAASYGDPLTSRLATQGVAEAIVGTPDGKGYWIAFSDGGVFANGDATFWGSMGGRTLASGVVAMARTPDGRGYWLAARPTAGSSPSGMPRSRAPWPHCIWRGLRPRRRSVRGVHGRALDRLARRRHHGLGRRISRITPMATADVTAAATAVRP